MSHPYFKKLTCFESFEGTTQFHRYQPIPTDWFVFIADIANSTEAAERGMYKEVNLIGASCIISVLNESGEDSMLYVFGGDGATFVVPPELAESTQSALLATRAMAKTEFDLALRIAKIPVSELIERGYSLSAAKLRLGPTQTQSLLAGAGVSAADALAKSPEGKPFLVPSTEDNPPANFEGLECRWNPIPSERGEILSLLVECNLSEQQASEVFAEVVNQVEASYPRSSPVKKEQLQLARSLSKHWSEAKVRVNSAVLRPFYVIFNYLLTFLWFGLSRTGAPKYEQELLQQSDYRKFDGVLRMVIDGTVAQHDALEAWLETKRQMGVLDFGMHRSQSALLTCLIFERFSGQHLHLVDGNDGGYTLAAKAMKARKRDRAEARKSG